MNRRSEGRPGGLLGLHCILALELLLVPHVMILLLAESVSIVEHVVMCVYMEVVLACHHVGLHGFTLRVRAFTIRLTVVFTVRVGTEARVVEYVAHIVGLFEHVPMLLVLIVLSDHLDIILHLLAILLLKLIFPHLGDALGELVVDRNRNICTLLDQNDTIIEVILQECDTQGRVPVDILAFQLCTSLQDVEGADSSTTLCSIVQGCLFPLVRHFNFQVFDRAQ